MTKKNVNFVSFFATQHSFLCGAANLAKTCKTKTTKKKALKGFFLSSGDLGKLAHLGRREEEMHEEDKQEETDKDKD